MAVLNRLLFCGLFVVVQVLLASAKPNEMSLGVSVNAEVGSKVGDKIPVSDPDGDTLVFSITKGNERGKFRIDNETGQLYVAAPFDSTEEKGKVRLDILASDGKGGDVNIGVVVFIYQGTCHVCATILEFVHKELNRQYETAAGNDLQMKHLFKNTNITKISENLCSDPKSVLSSKQYYPICQKIAVEQAGLVAAAFQKKRKANFGGDDPKKTFSRILDLCSATMGLCKKPTETDLKRYKALSKDRCHKCISTVEDLEFQSLRWQREATATAVEQTGKDPHSMTVMELRTELKSRKLTTKGLRPDLIQRLIGARTDEFTSKRKRKKHRFLDRGHLENLLETSCGDMAFRHPTLLASTMSHLCEELTEDYMDEISDSIIKASETYNPESVFTTSGSLSKYVCGPKVARYCTEDKLESYFPERYVSPFADVATTEVSKEGKTDL